jgi:glycerol-3-phosphate dehydrogenase
VDLLVIGGGINGAAIMREAARAGLRVLLVEQNDFASGTSSRSSKLIHGGLHYLARLEVGLALNAIRQRERMLRCGCSLIQRLPFLLPVLDGGRSGKAWQYALLLTVYEALAGRLHLSRCIRTDPLASGSSRTPSGIRDGFMYEDAQIDDARLVLSILRQGLASGGAASSYTTARGLLRSPDGRVVGAELQDGATGRTMQIRSRVVVNATGPWTDRLRAQIGRPARIRVVRGSHLVFPRRRLPLPFAIASIHPRTREPFYCIPWEGVTLVGSTAVEVDAPGELEPAIAPGEASTLLEGVRALFPSLHLTARDVQSTFAGLRPIVQRNGGPAATASREAAIWEEEGLLTVAGGKITTFPAVARAVMERLQPSFPSLRQPVTALPLLEPDPPLPPDLPFSRATASRLAARYGPDGLGAMAMMSAEDHRPIRSEGPLWAELRWAARAESVRHLDDLLLRRLRVGLTLPDGAFGLLPRVRPIVQAELGWSDGRWLEEEERYRERWRASHGMPAGPRPDAASTRPARAATLI